MDQSLRVVIELNEYTWNGFRSDLDDLTPEEVDWRPLPEANTINLIVRHLRIDLPLHLQRINGEPDADGAQFDAVPLDFERNLQALDSLYSQFIGALRGMTLDDIERQSRRAYPPARTGSAPHFLGFHWAMHLARHWGQVRTIRNLYRKTRGETARFFPDNPTFPQ